MERSLGYFLSGLGIIGVVFFLFYRSTAIPVKELWFVMSIIITIAGGYFLVKHRLQQSAALAAVNNSRADAIRKLMKYGEKVRVTLDNAEVKTRHFRQEVLDDGIPDEMQMLNALTRQDSGYSSEVVKQTYLVFYKVYEGQIYKFISQSTSMDEVYVKMHMDKEGGIHLYIDKANPANYYFDFPFV